jgi:type IV secretion system protein VirB3
MMNQIIDDGEQPPAVYKSFNGLGRPPMTWGVPYMAGLFIMCASMLPGLFLGVFIHPAGWLFTPVVGIPLVIYVRILCETDTQALRILRVEIKWAILKRMGGNSQFYGGTFGIAPMSYGRKRINVERGITAAIRR